MAREKVHAVKQARASQAQKNLSVIKTALVFGGVVFFGFIYFIAKFVNLY